MRVGVWERHLVVEEVVIPLGRVPLKKVRMSRAEYVRLAKAIASQFLSNPDVVKVEIDLKSTEGLSGSWEPNKVTEKVFVVRVYRLPRDVVEALAAKAARKQRI